MTTVKVLLIIFGVLVLLGLIPIGAYCRYDGDTLIELHLGPVRLRLLPKQPLTEKQQEKQARKKAEKAKKKKEKQETSLVQKKPKEEKPKEPLKERISQLLPFMKLVKDMLGTFRRRLLVKKLILRVQMTGSDPAKLSLDTGKAWAAIASMMPFLKGIFRIRSSDIQVRPDFVGTSTRVEAVLHIRIFLADVIFILIKYGLKGLKLYFAYKKHQDNLKKAVQQ